MSYQQLNQGEVSSYQNLIVFLRTVWEEVVEVSPSFARKIEAVKKEGFNLGAEASELSV